MKAPILTENQESYYEALVGKDNSKSIPRDLFKTEILDGCLTECKICKKLIDKKDFYCSVECQKAGVKIIEGHIDNIYYYEQMIMHSSSDGVLNIVTSLEFLRFRDDKLYKLFSLNPQTVLQELNSIIDYLESPSLDATTGVRSATAWVTLELFCWNQIKVSYLDVIKYAPKFNSINEVNAFFFDIYG
jgi:hypothetical protein